MTNRPEYSYIGREACGCVTAAMVDDPDNKRTVAAEVARWIKAGLNVERVTHQYVRENFTTHCPHQPEPEQPTLFEMSE